MLKQEAAKERSLIANVTVGAIPATRVGKRARSRSRSLNPELRNLVARKPAPWVGRKTEKSRPMGNRMMGNRRMETWQQEACRLECHSWGAWKMWIRRMVTCEMVICKTVPRRLEVCKPAARRMVACMPAARRMVVCKRGARRLVACKQEARRMAGYKQEARTMEDCTLVVHRNCPLAEPRSSLLVDRRTPLVVRKKALAYRVALGRHNCFLVVHSPLEVREPLVGHSWVWAFRKTWVALRKSPSLLEHFFPRRRDREAREGHGRGGHDDRYLAHDRVAHDVPEVGDDDGGGLLRPYSTDGCLRLGRLGCYYLNCYCD